VAMSPSSMLDSASLADDGILNSLRELGSLRREIDRLGIVLEAHKSSRDRDLIATSAKVQKHLDRIAQDAASVAGLLESAGFAISQADVAP
jgi:hypothetical protein